MAFCRVSRYCAARAGCPVILIPPPDLAREIGRGPLARRFWRRTLTADQIVRDHGTPATG
jgi:hypothetical protein